MTSLPLAEALESSLGRDAACNAALSGGDDYELLVTLPAENVASAQRALGKLGLPLTVIGQCSDTLGVKGIAPNLGTGWQHFNEGAPVNRFSPSVWRRQRIFLRLVKAVERCPSAPGTFGTLRRACYSFPYWIMADLPLG